MHTYRDALPRARSAPILFPGTESREFAVSGGVGDGDSVEAAGDRASSWEGVGAVPLRPGEGDEALRVVLKRMLGP